MKSLEKARRFLRSLVGLRAGTDAEGTISYVSENVQLRGVNIWMLVCSAILTSIGLDLNSSAVIIGGMLISPLMSPILGVGLGVAIFDSKLLKRALSSLSFASAVGILTSMVYFALSPLSELTPELTARTTPTILDVGVAFFGGVAGIVAGSRRDKTNAIPGVAIATALMPPLCTVGFGLANQDSGILLGAFYLFFINAVFIAIATYLISAALKFPKRSIVDGETDARVKQFVLGLAILTVIPSGLIFYNVLERLRVEHGVKRFIDAEFRRDDRQPLQWEIIKTSLPHALKVYVVGKEIDDAERARLQDVLDGYGIGSLHLKPMQLNVSPDDFNRLNTDVESNLTKNIKLLQAVTEERETYMSELRSRVDALAAAGDPRARFISDSRAIFPEIAGLAWQPAEGEDAERSNLSIEFQPDVPDADKMRISTNLRERARLLFGDENITITEPRSEIQTVLGEQ